MFGWFKKTPQTKYSATYARDTVEYAGVTYTVRELSVAERTYFVELVKSEEDHGLAVAWLVHKACDEFVSVRPADLMMEVGPGALNAISHGILKVSGMAVDDDAAEGTAEDAAEKKSEGAPS